MAGITLEQAETKLQLWLDADDKVARSQYYMMGDRQLTRANAAEIRQNIDYWQRKVDRLSRGGGLPMMRGLPCD
jgi:hypothetical protein